MTGNIYEVQDALLYMDDDTQIALHNMRIIVSPLPDAEAIRRRERSALRILDWTVKSTVILVALYLAGEVVHAFVSGAVARLLETVGGH